MPKQRACKWSSSLVARQAQAGCTHHLHKATQEGGDAVRARHQLAVLALPEAARAGAHALVGSPPHCLEACSMPPQQLDAAAGHSKESKGGAGAGTRACPPESSPLTAAPGHAEAQLLPDGIRASGSAGVQQHGAGIEAGAGAHTEQAVQQRQAGGAHDLRTAVGQSSGMPCRTSQQAGSRLGGGCARRVERRAAGCCHGGASCGAGMGRPGALLLPPTKLSGGRAAPEQPAMVPWPGQWQQGAGCAPHPPPRALQWRWQPPLEPQLPAAPRLLAKWKAPRPGLGSGAARL